MLNPSVRSIVEALERVPEAIVGEPETESTARGDGSAAQILSVDLTGHSSDRLDSQAGTSPERDEGDGSAKIIDHLDLIFEVPPALTDTEIRNVLSAKFGDDVWSGLSK